MTVNESLQDRIIRTLVGLTVTVGAVIMAAAVPVLSPTGIFIQCGSRSDTIAVCRVLRSWCLASRSAHITRTAAPCT